MTDTIEVTTTTGTRDEAQRIAAALVERRLAACAQVQGPIQSTYWWRGKVESAEEWRCVAKTRWQLFEQVETAIRQLHSYETPEILAVRVEAGSSAYLQWVHDELTTANQGRGSAATE
jgi:periplasmic divalent cation tolerance protein